MRPDSRLSRMLHALLHMHRREAPTSSEVIAEMLGINPGVVRRNMGALRKSRIVTALKGHGGGWTLARKLEDITLQDVYEALGYPNLFALGPTLDSPTCPLEGAANAALNEGLSKASQAFSGHLRSMTLADLIDEAGRRTEL